MPMTSCVEGHIFSDVRRAMKNIGIRTSCFTLLAIASISGCQPDQGAAIGGNRVDPKHPVLVNTGPWEGLSVVALAEEERKSIDRIVAMAPEGNRDAIRAMLQRPFSAPAGADDPEIAREMSKLTSIRRAAAEKAIALAVPPVGDGVRLRVAILETGGQKNGTHIVTRPADGGHPIVVVPADGSGSDLAFALRLAADPATKPKKAMRIDVKARGDAAIPESDYWSRVLQSIRSNPVREIAGVGRVRYTDVLVPRADALAPRRTR
jgi:hypothetical protein